MDNLLKGVVAVATLGVGAATLSAQIASSSHDFTISTGPAAYAFQTRASNICGTCHTIHNALSTDAPLWIHTTTTANFTLYSSGTLNAVPNQPANNTRACLSCHDGTVAVNSVNGLLNGGDTTATKPATFITGTALLGTDLSNDHPVSISYAAGDSALNPIATVRTIYPLFGPAKDQVECASCHDPHKPGTNGLFFRGTPTAYRSRCVVCHIK